VTAPRPRRRLITIEAAAEYLNVSHRSVQRYIAAGRLRSYRVGPRLIKVDMAEVEAFARPIAADSQPAAV
jgi:excisionase family DNA binding protein